MRRRIKKKHVYRDAIRGTVGSYVLYPGDNDILYQPFHDTFPGIVAISVRPTEMNEGKCKLTKFMQDILLHYLNRTSDRGKMAHRLYEIHKTGVPREHLTLFPESHGDHKSLLPENTYMLVSPYASEEHLHWILKNKLYNPQIENRKSIDLLRTRYILLYSKQHKNTTQLLLLDKQPLK